jgi:two-component system CheB/CheR fusion protein
MLEHTSTPSNDTKPIPTFFIGIGASAGGLEALETFFSSVSPNTGMSFIVIQHLSPDYKSMMVELLSKKTKMKVYRAEEGMVVEPDSVYLITPKKNLTIFHGSLLLTDQDHSKGINLPIDIFFKSLAEDQAEKSVGIVLSGTGSDGVRGIRAIKEAGGMVMAQNEASAKFDGMPRSAISTGLVDFILTPSEMPEKLIAFSKHPNAHKSDKSNPLLSDEESLTRIFSLLRQISQLDFTFYKPSTVIRRIERRMTINQIQELRDYVRFLESHTGEIQTLFKELLIGVTCFFRDREVFDEIMNFFLSKFTGSDNSKEFRIWIPGCSTGEEAYTYAITFKEIMEQCGKIFNIKIFATDIDKDALIQAGAGVYPESITADLNAKYLTKYFHLRDNKYHIDRSIREMVVFAQHNLIKDPPFTKIDLISCRNLLIYLQIVLQRKVLETFNYSLVPDGILVLGTSETTGEMNEYFDSINQKFKIYKSSGRKGVISPGIDFRGVSHSHANLSKATSFISRRFAAQSHDEERMLDRIISVLSEEYIPLTFIVNKFYEILHIIGNPAEYLKLVPGKVINDISKFAVKELVIPLSTGLQRVFKSSEDIKYTNIRIQSENTIKFVSMHIRIMQTKKGQDPLAAIIIKENPGTTQNCSENNNLQIFDVNKQAQDRIYDLEQELQFMRENLQATIEELETSNEELQATNEELLASNEELQSTNEELQSVNEELHTVNSQYQRKIMDLTELNNDLDNLMAVTKIGTIFLDENFEIRRFTPEITRIFKIIENDIGRPVFHLHHSIKGVDPFIAMREVLSTGKDIHLEVSTVEGNWFLMRIVPYKISYSANSGVVLTFIDYTQLKKAQDALANSEWRLSSINLTSLMGMCLLSDWTFLEVNDTFCSLLHYERHEILHKGFNILFKSELLFNNTMKSVTDLIISSKNGQIETRLLKKDGTELPALLSFTSDSPNKQNTLFLTIHDLTFKENAQSSIQEAKERYQMLFETISQGIVYQNKDGLITSANLAAQKLLGLSLDEMTGRKSIDPRWKAIRRDGSDYPGDEHPAMIALKTGQPVANSVMGVFNPVENETKWLEINAEPLFDNGDTIPSQVYTIFNDITDRYK